MPETPSPRLPWRPLWAVTAAWLGVGLALLLVCFGSKAAGDATPWSIGPVIGPILIVEGAVAGIAMAWFLVKNSLTAFVLGVLAFLPFLWVAFEVTS